MRWTDENENSLSSSHLLSKVASNTDINRIMSEADFKIVLDYMIEKEFAHPIKGGKIYILAKSMTEISNELVNWAEKAGIVD